MTLLESLPRSYAILVTAIETRMDGVSLDYVPQALVHEEIKQSEPSGQLSGAESALVGAFKRDTPRNRPLLSKRICLAICPHDVGHIPRYCPRKRKWHKAINAKNEES